MKKDWTYKKLGEVAKVVHGKNQKDVLSEDGQYPIYGSGGNIMGYANDYLCEAGTTILGRKGSINNPMFIEEPFWNVDTAFGISAKEGSNSKYLYYFIKSIDWQEKNTGTTLPSLTQQVVKDVEIPLPPLSEQSRIVSRLDAAFGEIEGLKAKAEAQLREARALFQAALTQEMKPKQGWEEKAFGEICKFSQGVQVPLPEQSLEKKEGHSRFLRIIDYTQGNETPRYVAITDKRYYVSKTDIALVRYGTPGYVCMGLEGIIANNLFKVTINDRSRIDTFYLCYFLKSSLFQSKLQKNVVGAALQAISFGLIRNIPIPLPPLLAQQSIVSRLDALSEKVRELEEAQKKVIAECDALKQAMLREVFE